jgi:hypothetical protein
MVMILMVMICMVIILMDIIIRDLIGMVLTKMANISHYIKKYYLINY